MRCGIRDGKGGLGIEKDGLINRPTNRASRRDFIVLLLYLTVGTTEQPHKEDSAKEGSHFRGW